MSDYSKLPDAPGDAGGASVLNHVLDSLGFRFYWATEGLGDADLGFSPGEGAMTLGRQMAHVKRLLQWTDVALQSRSEMVDEVETDFASMRDGVFEALDGLKARVADMGEEGLLGVEVFGFPFWNLVAGPVTDCIAHVGQINVYRRLLGKPAPRINYFAGKVG